MYERKQWILALALIFLVALPVDAMDFKKGMTGGLSALTTSSVFMGYHLLGFVRKGYVASEFYPPVMATIMLSSALAGISGFGASSFKPANRSHERAVCLGGAIGFVLSVLTLREVVTPIMMLSKVAEGFPFYLNLLTQV